MASYICLTKNEKEKLPPGYEVDKAAECFHWACGRAYATPIGREVKPFIVHPDGIAMCEIRGEELLIVFRGTVMAMVNEVARNIFGCGIDPAQLFDDGDTTCMPGEPRCHKMYILRAFDALFTWLHIDVFGEKRGWHQLRKITICGHSMGGSVAMLFAWLLKHTDERLHSLKHGCTMTVVGLGEVYNNQCLRLAPALRLERRESNFYNHKTGNMLPWESVVLHPDCEISVYSFSSTQIGNYAFKRMYEQTITRSYNHYMYWDPVTPLVFPWTFKPGYQLPIAMKKDTWKFCINFFTGGSQLHAPSHLLFSCFYEYFSYHNLDKDRLWKLLEPHLRVDPLVTKIGDIGAGKSSWMTIPSELEGKIRQDSALQRELLCGGVSTMTHEDLMFVWNDPQVVSNSSIILATFAVCVLIPVAFCVLGIILVLCSVFTPLVLFPYVIYSYIVDRLFWYIGFAGYLMRRKHRRQLHRLGAISPYEDEPNLEAADVETATPQAQVKAPALAPPTNGYVKALRQKNGYSAAP